MCVCVSASFTEFVCLHQPLCGLYCRIQKCREKITRSKIVSLSHTHTHTLQACQPPKVGELSEVSACACVSAHPHLEERGDGPSISLQRQPYI